MVSDAFFLPSVVLDEPRLKSQKQCAKKFTSTLTSNVPEVVWLWELRHAKNRPHRRHRNARSDACDQIPSVCADASQTRRHHRPPIRRRRSHWCPNCQINNSLPSQNSFIVWYSGDPPRFCCLCFRNFCLQRHTALHIPRNRIHCVKKQFLLTLRFPSGRFLIGWLNLLYFFASISFSRNLLPSILVIGRRHCAYGTSSPQAISDDFWGPTNTAH